MITDVRRWLFGGRSFTAAQITNKLDDHSWTATRSAFSARLGHLGLDVFKLLVPDILHEYEIGFVKHIFTQLLRLLQELAPENVALLNERSVTISNWLCRHA